MTKEFKFKDQNNIPSFEEQTRMNNVLLNKTIRGGSIFKPLKMMVGNKKFFWDGDTLIIDADRIKIGRVIKSVAPGDDIQAAIDEVNEQGGGEVILQNGVHQPVNDINIYSGIYLRGQTAQSTIVDFQAQAYGINVVGSNSYTTGTISVTGGGTTVTGAGTAWTTAMIGRNILISGIWYPIANVNSGTQEITLAAPFVDIDVAGVSYVIATTINDIKVENFTIMNSNASALKVQYGNFGNLDGMIITSSLVGIEFRDSSTYTFGISSMDGLYNYTNFIWDNVHYVTTTGAGSIATLSGNGWEISNTTYSVINDSFILGSVGNGLLITSCSTVLFKGVTSKGNGGKGIELVSGNDYVKFNSCEASYNISDGIKLTATSDNGTINDCILKMNGGYGINIAAATCDNVHLIMNLFDTNTSGDYIDNGTGTVVYNTTEIILGTSSSIKGGQTAYNTGTGFFLGYSGGAYKFSLGNPAGSNLTWDGTTLKIDGISVGTSTLKRVFVPISASGSATNGWSTAGEEIIPAKVLADGSDVDCGFSFFVPTGYTSCTIKLLWESVAASGNMYYNASLLYGAIGEELTADNSVTGQTVATGGAYYLNGTTLAVVTGVTGGDFVGVRFTRRASDITDTLGQAVHVLGGLVEFT